MEMTTGFTRWTLMYIWFSRRNRNVTNAKIRIERSKHQCQIGVEDGGYYIPVLGIGLHVTMVQNSSDPRLVLNMWRMASGVLLSTNISLTMSTVKFSVNMHFFVGHVSCLRILSNDPGKMDSNFFCYAATVLSPHRKLLIITERMHKPTWRPFTQ